MSGRARLEPKEHIPGEWNIILLHRYLPVSSGDHELATRELTEEERSRRALVQKAKTLYADGVSICQIARDIGVSQPLISHWKSLEWCVETRVSRKKKKV